MDIRYFMIAGESLPAYVVVFNDRAIGQAWWEDDGQLPAWHAGTVDRGMHRGGFETRVEAGRWLARRQRMIGKQAITRRKEVG